MLRIGLTGGIGSGKTTVAHIFEVLGAPVYYADSAAKKLMNSDPELRTKIIGAFGSASYEGTEINRSFLASEVFYDSGKLDTLNSIVHPAVFADAELWMSRQSFSYAVKEAAILFESGSNKQLDYVIGVTAPEELRIERLIKRDGKSLEEIKFFMDRQMNEDEKMRLCDFVIINDEQQLIIPQVLELHQRFTGA